MTIWHLFLVYLVLGYDAPHDIGPFSYASVEACRHAGLSSPRYIHIGPDVAQFVSFKCIPKGNNV